MMGRAMRWLAGAAAVLMASGALAHEGHDKPDCPIPRIVEGSLETIGTGYTFTEGTAWGGTRLNFSGIRGETVYA